MGIVVATEMAARGLDAPLLTHVINLDLPTNASYYAHRAGRVGRGGRPGVVINLTTCPAERNVPAKWAQQLGVTMHTVEVRNAKLNIVESPHVLESSGGFNAFMHNGSSATPGIQFEASPQAPMSLDYFLNDPPQAHDE